MSNKNKKRRRIVLTSDVVPAGSREEVNQPEVKIDEVAAASAAPVSASEVEAEESNGAAAPLDPEENASDVATEAVLEGDAPPSAEAEGVDEVEAVDEGAAVDEVTVPDAHGEELWAPEETELPAVTMPAVDVTRAHLKGLIEALVFVADQPLSLNDIAKAAGRADRKLVRALADELRQDYARRGIHLDEVAGGLIFRTNAAYAPFVRDAAAKKPVRMTRAQLETLAIIAYRQPLTRPEVDEVRGVDSGPVMKMLLERGLIKILGKKDEPGRPLLYGTTHTFLEFFGLKALKDLPSLREFTELNDDSRRVYDREMADSPDAPTDSDLATLTAAASAVGPGAPVESAADVDGDPARVMPSDGPPGEWFERPTEPDTSVEALEPTPDADLQGSDENGIEPGSDPDESEAQA
ncbi:MAG TPA: SMC-Scp complex subunit ScpB [Polyangiaceae bacterium]|nr:SMC-Scp complex subunit ScpB [Polyangiaceae bacterium]